MQGGQEGSPGFEPGLAEQLHRSLAEQAGRLEAQGQPAVLLVAPPIRGWVAKLVRHSIPALHVLSYNEIPDDRQIRVVASVGQGPAGLQQS